MSREINPYGLRMPPLLKKVLGKLAGESRRSLNAEIVSRLESSLKKDDIVWAGNLVKETHKIYDVQPTVSTKTKFKERYTKKGVDNVALSVAIEAAEKYIYKQKSKLSIDKKALLIAIVYNLIDDEEPDANSIDNKTIDMLLKLAS